MFSASLGQREELQQAQAQVQQVEAEQTNLEQELSGLPVAADVVRLVMKTDAREIALVPELPQVLPALARIVAEKPQLRVRQMTWRVLAAAQANEVCGKPATVEVAATPASAPVDTAAATTSALTAELPMAVELQFDLTYLGESGPRENARVFADVSRRLAQLPGATVLVDPAATLADGKIEGSQARQLDQTRTWCLRLQAATNPATPTQGGKQ